MANKETVDKVKSLLEGHCYGPLRDAAEKWLEVADEKYAVKDKAGKAWDKLNDAAVKFSDASIKFNEKMGDVSDKAADLADKIQENAGPAMDKLSDLAGKYSDAAVKANEKLGDVSGKVGDAAEKLAESELVKQLKEGICSVGDLLDTFGGKEAAERFGEDFTGKMKAHAETLKAKGEQFCDCDACVKAREILKDLGEDITSKVDELKDKGKAPEEAEASAEEPAAEEPEEPAEAE